ncbi:MAG: hypothetical protein LC790_18465, partial [Actinobacteria bacterium]|nr:hypothetical protein [Actinomycetota bacterium]
MAAIRTKNTYLRALYERQRSRIGHGKAIGAVKHSILQAIWHMLSTGETYRDLGGDYFARHNPQRATRRLVAQLERLGHTVTLQRQSHRGANVFSLQFPMRRLRAAPASDENVWAERSW